MRCPDCKLEGKQVHLPFWEKRPDGRRALITFLFCDAGHLWYAVSRCDITGTFKVIAIETVKERLSTL